MSTSAKLVLADGTIYAGTTYAATGSVFGQLVFDTTMTGYQHSLTNPSNAATIMVFTFPHIGIAGVDTDVTDVGEREYQDRKSVV